MRSQAWDRFTRAMDAFASQCPLFGVCHRAVTSLTSAVRRSSESDAAPQGAIESTSATSAATPVILTDGNFSQQVERSRGVALVDFWAPWCMPCRRVGPIIERLAGEYEGRATVGKLNVDQNMAVARRYGISGIPTVGVFRNGKLVNQLVGAQSEHAYRKAVDSALADAAAATAKAAVASAAMTKGAKPAKGATAAVSAKPATTSEGAKVAKASAPAHNVTVFSTPSCPWCSRLKVYLREKQIPFKDVDVSRDAAAAREMIRRSGQMGVPQAWIDDQVIVGFDRKRVDKLIGSPAGRA